MQSTFILPVWPLNGHLTPIHSYFLKQFEYGLRDVIVDAAKIMLLSTGKLSDQHVADAWNPNQLGNKYMDLSTKTQLRWTLQEATDIYRTILVVVYRELYNYLKVIVDPMRQPANLGSVWASGVRMHVDGIEMTLHVEYMSF